MSAELGEVYGTCACGCGVEMRERIYRYPKRGPIVNRPEFLGHHHRRGRPGDMVSPQAVALAVGAYKMRTGQTWRQVNKVLGYAPSPSGQASWLANGKEPVSRKVAEHVLRRLAGLPTPATRHEQRLNARLTEAGHRMDAEGKKRRTAA